MRGLMQTVYSNYPSAVKLLKGPSYQSSWQPQAWYRLQHRSSSVYLYRRNNGFIGFSRDSGRTSEWQFNPAVSKGLVGLFGRDGNRLKIDSYYASGMTGHLEEMTKRTDVVFKIIPLNVSEPVLQFAGPYRESDTSWIDCRLNRNAGVCVPFNDFVFRTV